MKFLTSFHISRLTLLALILFIGLVASRTTLADEVSPCQEDVQKFCKDVKSGDGRVMKCLKEHDAELSPSCKNKRAEIRQKVRDFAEACREDAQKLCADVKKGGGRVLKCLRDHKSEVSTGCSVALKQ